MVVLVLDEGAPEAEFDPGLGACDGARSGAYEELFVGLLHNGEVYAPVK